ncbi:MAG: twin-arginine translocase TatA/TatE family subunit [Thiotrichaceae bacterium]
MGFSGISPWSLVLILIIVLVLFGTKRLRNAGGDLGSAIKNFKKSMSDSSTDSGKDAETPKVSKQDANRVIDSEAKEKNNV